MTIIPIIIIIILIYQLLASRLYDYKVEYNYNYLNLITNSLSMNDREYLENPEPQQFLDKLLSDFDLTGQAFYVIDPHNTILYSKNGVHIEAQSYTEAILNYEFEASNQDGYIMEDAFITHFTDEMTGNKYILLTIPSLMNNKIYFIKELIIIIVIVSIVSILSIILISYYLTLPIRKLSKDIEKNTVNFNEKVIVKDEIWDISIHLKKIYQELITQNEIRYYLESKTNKAQFEALQSQINPHFLYNTLGTINSIAVIEKVPLISELSKSLANMFRYSISTDNGVVRLQDELNHIENYLNVQLIRFDGIIEKVVKVDESLLSCNVVKLMLQPIVENCFIHAFEDLDEEKGIVQIVAERQDSSVIISVEDNGVFIDEKKLKHLNKMLEETDREPENQQNKSIGLSNVHSRIKLAFGKEYGLSFESLPVKGLRVIIKVPFKAMDEV